MSFKPKLLWFKWHSILPLKVVAYDDDNDKEQNFHSIVLDESYRKWEEDAPIFLGLRNTHFKIVTFFELFKFAMSSVMSIYFVCAL